MDIVLFSMIAMRISGLIFMNPLFGRRNVPNNAKAAMVLVFTFLVYSTMEEPELSYEFASSFLYGFFLLKEFLVGYVLGYVMELFFFVITHAGSIIDFHMGLSMSMVYDPQTNAQIAMSGNLYQIFYTLIFFAVDGHLVLIRMLLRSGELVPYGEVVFTQGLALAVLDLFRGCVVLAVRFAFPIIAIEFLVEVAVGIMMKMAPQVNVFVINIQIKIAVGFLVLLFLLSPMKSWLEDLMHQMLMTMQEFLNYL
ncbi:MAG: flagellar biosynthetic protein FliR [Lachnospiraceae bacterium]|jgi:flagellar biosynthetic protein FliR|uniref:flagellar biosynthetic protein FliR n=1 Tax=Candidatus Merdisoma sp. JLR.KK011 TaxID=3114299 RepID=UPI0014346EE7|nr:flagellar biosynthetic protein FliR [Lachnospiraceae bacterium]MCI9253118.1 flagellar biosynthetic protein FliR [Lachnospiraceae bacterium]MCI9477677.1 flagellar biosynthetic protein FliR [Lachnospiraceae bacterium]MCI9622790.1 flagellar biosynthetic protein FliR [Lachnospiraceae bacterium]GFI08154.1 surface presentation of antigens protein SpaR [Lachnospiraceae bacterium]